MKSASLGNKPRRVKAAFIGPFAIVLTFILGAFAATAYFVEVRVRDRDLAERSAAVAKLFDQKLSKDTNLMQAVLRSMMDNNAIETAFAARNRGALMREAGPLFQTLHDDHLITHLYFTGSDLVNVLRLHSPGEFGDTINRSTMLQAKVREDAVHGLELGPLGTLTLRLVMPWRRNYSILGYLEIGEEIEHLVGEIHDSLSVDLFVLVDKRFLLPEQWQRGLTLLNRKGNWNRFDSHAAVAQTARQVPAALNNGVLDNLLSGGTMVFDESGHTLHVATRPISDAGGRHIGELLVIRDITDLQTTFRWSVTAVTLLCLFAGAGVLGIFYFALDRVEHDYQRQHDLEHQLLRLNTEHQHIIQVEKLSALGTMVGEIAHQLNNPLVGVVNFAQLADREADDPVRTRELLAEIRRAGEECHDFIRRMLEFSKSSCFESTPTAMAELIEETVLLFRQTEKRRVQVETHLPEQPVNLTVDPILIRHALFNLLLNASQATPDGGTIIIALARTPSSGADAAGWALSVTDHGKGIPPELMDKIFVPFFTTRNDGTGLGLPVVQHVALLHDGYVTATSQLGDGTKFAFWLPENG